MLNDLQDILVQLYSQPAEARRLGLQAGIPEGYIDYSGNMRQVWRSVIVEADRRGLLVELVKQAVKEYPQRPELQHIFGGLLYGGRRVNRDVGEVVTDGEKLDEIREMVYQVRERTSVLFVWLIALTVGVGVVVAIQVF